MVQVAIWFPPEGASKAVTVYALSSTPLTVWSLIGAPPSEDGAAQLTTAPPSSPYAVIDVASTAPG